MGGPNLAPQANLRGTSRHTTVIPASRARYLPLERTEWPCVPLANHLTLR
jgi:hypothetical protein